jgi:hypothetical protein
MQNDEIEKKTIKIRDKKPESTWVNLTNPPLAT